MIVPLANAVSILNHELAFKQITEYNTTNKKVKLYEAR